MIHKTQRGITLIALIITVIVLLILAGTAISIAVNGGDIFSKASEARSTWNTAVENEEQTIKGVLSYLVPGAPTNIIKCSFHLNGNNSKLRVKATGGEAYKYKLSTSDTWSDAIPNGTEYEFTRLSANQTYTVQAICTNSFGDGTEITEKQMTIAYEGNIGKYVHYPVDLEVGTTTGETALDDDWVVFYEDEEDGITYLIAADYVKSSITTFGATSENGFYDGRAGLRDVVNVGPSYNSEYDVVWQNAMTSLRDYPTATLNINRLITANNRMATKWSSWYREESVDGNIIGNLKKEKHAAAAFLIDTTTWDDFVLKNNNSTAYDNSIQAAGGPALELFIASWQQKGYEPISYSLVSSETYGSGYLLGRNSYDSQNITYFSPSRI